MNLHNFISNDKLRNAWIKERGISIYIRRSVRLLDPNSTTATPCLDIGSVEVDEDERGKGIFTAFLSRFEREAEKIGRAVYVESILEPRLKKFLLKQGYQLVPNSSEMSPSMFKIPS